MTRTRSLVGQAVLAGLVAALVLMAGQNFVSQAQEPPPDEGEPPAEEQTESTPEASVDDIMSDVDPCSLITTGEAAAALGVDVTMQAHSDQCAYVAMDLTGRAISVAAPGPIFAEPGLETVMTSLADALEGEVRTIELADEAAGVFSAHVSQVVARAGEDRLVLVTLLTPEGSVDQQAATLTDLASIAISRR